MLEKISVWDMQWSREEVSDKAMFKNYVLKEKCLKKDTAQLYYPPLHPQLLCENVWLIRIDKRTHLLILSILLRWAVFWQSLTTPVLGQDYISLFNWILGKDVFKDVETPFQQTKFSLARLIPETTHLICPPWFYYCNIITIQSYTIQRHKTYASWRLLRVRTKSTSFEPQKSDQTWRFCIKMDWSFNRKTYQVVCNHRHWCTSHGMHSKPFS